LSEIRVASNFSSDLFSSSRRSLQNDANAEIIFGKALPTVLGFYVNATFVEGCAKYFLSAENRYAAHSMIIFLNRGIALINRVAGIL
jgi:hypothetical protein